jgi:PhnB protein
MVAANREDRMVKAIPDGYHTVTPYLIVKGGGRAIDFYARAFAAVERERMQDPAGKVRHAEIEIGTSRIMLADEHPEIGALSPDTVGGSPVSLHLYVEDVDAVVARAVAAGARLTRPVADQFYGDRVGGVTDPFGHRWFIATHKEDLTSEELQRRAAQQGH